MGIVTETFRDSTTGIIYDPGYEYLGEREAEFLAAGVLKDTNTTEEPTEEVAQVKAPSTIDEIKAELDKLGVKYDAKSKKAELLELLKAQA